MFERILYIVGERQEGRRLVVKLARPGNSAVLLSGSMSPACLEGGRDGRTRNEVVREEAERKCWQDLYRLEEGLKQEGVRATVIAQSGGIENLRDLVNSTHCDLVLIPAGALTDGDRRLPGELIADLPCPLLIANPE